jgi:hypothetical protein
MSAFTPDYFAVGIARQQLVPGLSTPTPLRSSTEADDLTKKAYPTHLPCLRTPALRSSHRAYSAGLHRRSCDVRHRMLLHPEVQKIRHFSSRHRIRLSVTVASWPEAMRHGGLVCRSVVPSGATRPFLTPPLDEGYLRSSHLGCTPHTKFTSGMLRPLSGLADPSVQLASCGAG